MGGCGAAMAGPGCIFIAVVGERETLGERKEGDR